MAGRVRRTANVDYPNGNLCLPCQIVHRFLRALRLPGRVRGASFIHGAPRLVGWLLETMNAQGRMLYEALVLRSPPAPDLSATHVPPRLTLRFFFLCIERPKMIGVRLPVVMPFTVRRLSPLCCRLGPHEGVVAVEAILDTEESIAIAMELGQTDLKRAMFDKEHSAADLLR